MATDNHTVDGLQAYAGLLLPASLRHGVGFLWRGRAGATGSFEAWMPVHQAALAAMGLGTIGVFAFELAAVQAMGGMLAVSGLGVFLVAFLVSSAVADAVPGEVVAPVDTQDETEGALVPQGEGLWTVRVPLTFHGMPFGTRMAVIDTGEGLLLYSPVQATDARVQAVRALGEVRWIVAPNPLHHLFVEGWIAACPDAVTVAAPGLPERRGDLRWDHLLDDEIDTPWPEDHVATEVFHGHPSHVEIVLLHRPTGTLLVADLVQNLGHPVDGWSARHRWMLGLAGMARRPGPPTDLKLTVTDPAAMAASADRVAAWEPTRILPCHGPPIDRDVQQIWTRAFDFAR